MLRLALGILCTLAPVFGQSATGTVEGRVTDATGAVINQAKVTIRNARTNVQQQVTTNESGLFTQPYLVPGSYDVLVESTGFRRYEQKGIGVQVQQTVRVDVQLEIGELSNTVEVQASTAQLAVSNATVATVIGNKAIQDLPLNGRNPFALATLTPGVVPGPGSTPWISGGRNASSEITIDGTSVILPENNVGINTLAYTPPVDSVEEFSVVTNSLAAEYGRTGGGVINVATRSGTNQLHFSLYDYLRNSKLDANNFFSNRSGGRLGAFQRNQFGGTVGGPVRIPGLYNGQDKTFFFFSEQSTRTRSQSVFNTTVPLPEWLQGDFSNLRTAAGQPITIYDPLTGSLSGSNWIRTAFPGNRIPANRVDPVAARLRTFYPAPNTAPVNVNTQANNYTVSSKGKSGDDRFDAKLDHNFSSKFRMYGRGSYSRAANNPVNFFGNVATPSGDGDSSTDSYNVTLNGVYNFNSSTLLNLNYGFGRFVNVRFPFSTGFDPTQIGFPAAVRDQAATQNLEFPRFDIAGVSSLGQNTFTTLRFIPFSHNLRGDFTKLWSNHTVKVGYEYRKMFLNFLQLGNPAGQFTFNQGFTQQNPVVASGTQGFGLASFLLGTPSGGSFSHDPIPASASSYVGFYAQDDWKATRKLTFNLGIRWDADLPRTERYNRYSYFDLDAPSPIAGKVPGYSNLKGAMRFTTPDDRRQVPTDTNNWGPRFGFAYRANEKTVMRGAYALMYAGSMMQAAGSSGSAGMEGYRGSTPIIGSLDGGRTPATYLANPIPNGFNLPLGAAEVSNGGAETNLGLGIGESHFNNWINPVIQQWNFTLQRELPGSMIVEAGYLGSKGNHLVDGEGSMTYNQLPASYGELGNALNDLVPNPFFGVITNTSSILSRPTVVRSQLLRPFPQYTAVNAFRKPQANSIYHSFTLRAEKRFSQGLGFLMSLTAGKLIDDASQTVTFLGQAGNKQDFYNRPAERSVSTQDISRRLVLSANYDLPFGKGRALLTGMNSVGQFLLGGWQANGILTLQTGTPVIVTQNVNNTNLGSAGQRPDNNGRPAELTGGSTQDRIARWFDTSVFTFAQPFRFGNTPRVLPDTRNPGTRTLDFSVFKNFPFKERWRVQFRAEAFNLTNTPNFAAPGAQLGNAAAFGVISGLAQSPRQVQMVLRLEY